MMQQYEVGKQYIKALGHPEGFKFDVDDSGARMIAYYDAPTDHEKEQFKAGNPFEIRMVTLSDIIFLTVKIGDNDWSDMPYTPHLSHNLSKIEIPQDNQGLSVMIQLFNCRTGVLEHQRLISLSTGFTRKLFGDMMEIGHKGFDKRNHQTNINKIYAKYSTKDLVKLSTARFKLR